MQSHSYAALFALATAGFGLWVLGVGVLRVAILIVAVPAAATLASWGSRGPNRAALVTAALTVVIAAAVTRGAPIAVLAATGLGAATGVDLVERRIPTSIAHGTTIVSGISMTAASLSAHGPRSTASIWLSTGEVAAIYGGLWLVGGVGFGDVRLAGATVSAATAGFSYVALMVVVPLLVLPAVAGGWRLAGRRPPVPFSPALTIGWLVALSGLSL